MNAENLMQQARMAAKTAYAPYSRFRVGAALALTDGQIICGVNVENRSYGLSLCAERSALCTAIAQGRRDIRAVAVAGLDTAEALPPCGACRQVISEFCPPETPVYYDDGRGGFIASSIGELYPADSLQGLSNR